MKLDIVRAWKDENYRQALSEEQRNALPVNPAGDLTDAELDLVYGGGGGGGAPIAPAVTTSPSVGAVPVIHRRRVAVGVSTSASSFNEEHVHSFGLLCDVSIFSVNLLTIPVIPIVSPTTQCCENCD